MSDTMTEKDANTMRPDLALEGTDPRPDSKYDADQLREGVRVEMEHTKDPAVAKKIAKDHLDERKDYYQVVKREGL